VLHLGENAVGRDGFDIDIAFGEDLRLDRQQVVPARDLNAVAGIVECPSSEFFGELRRFRNGGSGSVSV